MDPYGPSSLCFFSDRNSTYFRMISLYSGLSILQDDYIVEHNFTYDLQEDILVHPKSRMS